MGTSSVSLNQVVISIFFMMLFCANMRWTLLRAAEFTLTDMSFSGCVISGEHNTYCEVQLASSGVSYEWLSILNCAFGLWVTTPKVSMDATFDVCFARSAKPKGDVFACQCTDEKLAPVMDNIGGACDGGLLQGLAKRHLFSPSEISYKNRSKIRATIVLRSHEEVLLSPSNNNHASSILLQRQ